MFKLILTQLVAFATVNSQSTIRAGLKNSLDIAILEQAKDTYFDMILSLINDIELPDIEDADGNYLRDNSFQISGRTDKVSFYADPAKNAIVFDCKKINAVARSGDFRYKEAPLLVAKGHAEVDMDTIEIQVGISFSTQTLADGRVVPYVTAVDIICSINRFDINIKLWGNLWTDLASLAEVFFVGTVAGLIEDVLYASLNTGVPLAFNTFAKATDGYLPLAIVPNWILDWETPLPFEVTTSNIQLGIRGLFFDKELGEEEPAVAIPDMPAHLNTHPEGYQTFISTYSIDSLLSSLLETAAIKFWVNSAAIPDTAPFDITTTTVNALLPGIAGYYGGNLPVDIRV
jgi:hypothetical protein